MKNTSKLIGLVLALIVVILAIFLVTKFNSHESAQVATVKSSVRTSQKTSSSSRKTIKKDNKSSQTSSSVASNEENDNQASAVAPKTSSQEQAQAGATDGGQVAESAAGTDNANGESVTINADGTIIKNSTGYTAQLNPQGVSDNTFNASVVSQDDSVALSAVAGASGSSDYLVIGANGPYYRN